MGQQILAYWDQFQLFMSWQSQELSSQHEILTLWSTSLLTVRRRNHGNESSVHLHKSHYTRSIYATDPTHLISNNTLVAYLVNGWKKIVYSSPWSFSLHLNIVIQPSNDIITLTRVICAIAYHGCVMCLHSWIRNAQKLPWRKAFTILHHPSVLSMLCMQGSYGYHLLTTLEWLDRISPQDSNSRLLGSAVRAFTNSAISPQWTRKAFEV